MGNFLVELSYELSKVEGKAGSPERPLSDLGLRSYRRYWTCAILNVLKNIDSSRITVEEISDSTKICESDILYTLNYHKLIHCTADYETILVDPKFVKNIIDNNYKFGPCFDSQKLNWIPM